MHNSVRLHELLQLVRLLELFNEEDPALLSHVLDMLELEPSPQANTFPQPIAVSITVTP